MGTVVTGERISNKDGNAHKRTAEDHWESQPTGAQAGQLEVQLAARTTIVSKLI